MDIEAMQHLKFKMFEKYLRKMCKEVGKEVDDSPK
ncbi:hypothetical protein Salpa_0457 [Sporomusa sp. KB1]|jgi:hypothetical protein|nr:hypothetical protein Salpa_0457 [Sporomusa sp. KB1]